MKCPYCGEMDSRVVDSRPTDEGESIRRRRECGGCKRRFTTYETVESLPIIVIKRDGTREPFDRNKLLKGLFKACDKRPVSLKQLELLADEVESYFQNRLMNEVSSNDIGELAIEKLRRLDEIAYVRFASVYRHFQDLPTFMSELSKLMNESDD